MTPPAPWPAARSATAGSRPPGCSASKRRATGPISRDRTPASFFLPPAPVNQTKIGALGLFTGQVGYAWSNVLWYVKGGAAATDNNYKGFIGGVLVDQASETRWGGTVGTGIEIGFAPNWSVGFEYDHLFMGNRNITFTAPGGGFTRTDNIRQDVDTGSVRVNYRWGGPVVSKY